MNGISENIFAAAEAISISPQNKVPLGASGAGEHEWEGISSGIEANALVIWEREGAEPVLFVTFDLLYPGRILRAAIEKAAWPLDPARIIVAASHTHRAPMTDDTKPGLGNPDPRYMKWVVEQVSKLVGDVLNAKQQLITFEISKTYAENSINRRRWKPIVLSRKPKINSVTYAPNPDGPTDERLTTGVLRAGDSQPIAVFWNYACHPVGGPAKNAVSGHFPTDIREHIRSELGLPNLPVLYFQGFSGDTRPNATSTVHSRRQKMRGLISGKVFDDMTASSYLEWTGSLSTRVTQSISSVEHHKFKEISVRRLSIPGDEFVIGGNLEPLTISRISLGDEVTFLGISGEVVCEYVEKVQEYFESSRNPSSPNAAQ